MGLRFLRIRREPEELARGLAIGVFIGLTPTLGFHMVLAVALSMVLKGNKIMAALATWVGNVVTLPFIFPMEYMIGKWLLRGDPLMLKNFSFTPSEILHASWNILLPLSVGSLVAGSVAAILVYPITKPIFRMLQERHQGKGRTT
jgi:uncharacterized protein (DUF2062 family)